jgi:predicted aspartyl protease
VEKVKITQINKLLFIDISLWSKKENKYRNMSVAIDTGASITTISEYILNSLGYKKTVMHFKITTASSSVEVQERHIHKLKLGNIEFSNIKVYAHNFPEETFIDGVLGMDVLENFNFKVDLDNHFLELDKRNLL